MRFATALPDETITELASRVFDARTNADLSAAKEVLVEANPHIQGRRKLDGGTVVEVPEVERAEPTAAAQPPTDVGPAVAIHGLRAALPDLFEAVRTGSDELVIGADREAKSLRSDRVKRAARKEKKTADEVRRTRETADYRLEESRSLRTEHKAALRDVESDLDDLLRLFGG